MKAVVVNGTGMGVADIEDAEVLILGDGITDDEIADCAVQGDDDPLFGAATKVLQVAHLVGLYGIVGEMIKEGRISPGNLLSDAYERVRRGP